MNFYHLIHSPQTNTTSKNLQSKKQTLEIETQYGKNTVVKEDYVDLFRIALNIVDDDFTVKNVDNHKAYFSHEIKKHIKQAIC